MIYRIGVKKINILEQIVEADSRELARKYLQVAVETGNLHYERNWTEELIEPIDGEADNRQVIFTHEEANQAAEQIACLLEHFVISNFRWRIPRETSIPVDFVMTDIELLDNILSKLTGKHIKYSGQRLPLTSYIG